MVYVLDPDGKPLMPTRSHGVVRRMLDRGDAKTVRTIPFTIQLREMPEDVYDEYGKDIRPRVHVGIDASTSVIGISAVYEGREVYAEEIVLRKDISLKLKQRKDYRKVRRLKKKTYTKRRSNNEPVDWSSYNTNFRLKPSNEAKVTAHVNAVNRLAKILPIGSISFEVAQFNKDAVADERYIKGPKGSGYNYNNVREYVLARDKHTCRICAGKRRSTVLHVVRVGDPNKCLSFLTSNPDISQNDSIPNHFTICESCYHKFKAMRDEYNYYQDHDPNQLPSTNHYLDYILKLGAFEETPVQQGRVRMRSLDFIKEEHPDFTILGVYGYETESQRIRAGLENTPINNARILAGNPRFTNDEYFHTILKRSQNRSTHEYSIRKGRNERLLKRDNVHGFRSYDLVKYGNKTCRISKLKLNGYFEIIWLKGRTSKKITSAKFTKLTLIERRKSYSTELRKF